MKDEEMAEEYAAKQNLQNVNPSGIVRCKIAEAFLAGLKAGRPQWHNLEKDPNDLPPKRVPRTDCVVKVLNPQCSVTVLDTFGNRVWFNYRNNRWRKEPFEEIEVIAWCEIPTFDKE